MKEKEEFDELRALILSELVDLIDKDPNFVESSQYEAIAKNVFKDYSTR